MNTGTLRIAVIGAGHLGTIHSRLWLIQPNVTLSAIYDTHPDRTERLVAQLHAEFPHATVRPASSLHDALTDCDAVTITTPTSSHANVAMAVLNAGKHCFIEKPLTSTLEEAESLAPLAEKFGCVVHVGHIERFNPALLPLYPQSLHPYFIETHRLAPMKPRALDVSVVLDLMIHDIDLALWFAQSPVRDIQANGRTVLTRHTDIATARLVFDNGCVAHCTVSRLAPTTQRTMALFSDDIHVYVDFATPRVDIFHFAPRGIAPSPLCAGSSLQLSQLLGHTAYVRSKDVWHETPTLPSVNALCQEQQAFIEELRFGKCNPRATRLREAQASLAIAAEIMRKIQ
ncbi:MAG: Gfo/Idh/MocA family oxidoreductase [Candidatus Kapabacteria bacterium]|nr:Gfo/Idh/MocA family oxidoreductase [Candidatus Kapabacteria bacterium]